MSLDRMLNGIKKEMDAKDKRREEVYALCRELRRNSTKAIREVHKEDLKVASKYLKVAKGLIASLTEEDLCQNFVQEAVQEYAEAAIVMALLRREDPPSPRELGIPSEAYLLGLADAIGEIRRHVLDLIRRGEVRDVEYYLDLMDEMFHGIMAFDYPNALLPIRRKQDVARSLLEKTRGEVTITMRQAELEKKMRR